ncbi:outer membrane protein assembly factor BamA [Campylobacter sp. JMF_01 NE2]|uniref:outer membrane protein assembly factor BamA n=1 Tax=unclassified Campylobacter TaxID=2593542 RepID=UPI0022EA0332|nr:MULTISPECIES: outer membrane protein assembly factor BamA [unclassified Campylobacter]MDA3046873.1 outer membrane protein assembly factor BamA [Campylobacter sp. VBCF_06 NA8]MDA3048466.1 outer membrane protein assembly factor BamA [Campylobacter sp. JMF_08 NE1]MDA3052942.1 outer membrane protein assembly factor BamA [Campylobacter sp. JMF_03 NE3]MDA3067273.1 outer membrane protein assembly factor BamA [Campylobacter sp. JMF_01 NE2]
MRKSLFLLLGGVSVACAAQIQTIKFEGLKHLSPQVAAAISGLQIGDQITGENTNRAISNLFAQGYFEDVYISEQGGNVTISVKEKPSVAKVDIKNVVTNDQDAIKNLIGLRPGQVYDEVLAKNAAARIKQFYEVKGFFDTVVEVTPKPLDSEGNAVHVIVDVNRGENIIIEKVNLIGAKKLDYDDIEPAVSNKQREVFGWLWGFNDGQLKANELPNDANRIQEEYYKKGYLDARVSAPIVNADTGDYTADLTYYVTEGERYKVSSIDIDCPENVTMDKEKVISDLKLEKGDTMNSDWMRRDIQKIETLVADQGYAYVKVVPQTDQDREAKTIGITYKIIPENKVYIRNVTISGNDKTEDKVVRREMYLTEGNLFSRTDYADSIAALKRTGYFENVEIKETRVSDDQLDLEVVVQETPTGSITGGIGYGSDDGLLLSGGISDRNVFGTGLSGSVSVEKSDDKLSGRVSLTNPRIFDSEYSLGGMVFANDYDWDDYEEKSYGFALTLGRKLGRNLSASLTYYLEKTEIEGLNEYYAAAGYRNHESIKSSITPALTYNSTDDYYLPRSGIIATASLEYAGLGGDIEFTKAKGSFNYYFGLRDYIDYDLIFRYKAAAGYVWDRGDPLPINEKLFLGGIRTVRGYNSRSIPRKEICVASGSCRYVETGGMQSFNNSVELSFPLIDRMKMRLVTFFDYGMIGDNDWNEEERYSAGAGIEWLTPMGPLQLYFTKPLNEKPHDKTNSFEFSIGARFN